DDFDLPFQLAQSLRLAVGTEGEGADLYLALGARLLLSEPHRGYLRGAVGTTGHGLHVELDRRVASDHLGRHLAHGRGHASQHQLARHVTNRVDARHAGLHPLVHLDEAALDFDPERFQAQILAVGDEADRGEYPIRFQHLRLAAALSGWT